MSNLPSRLMSADVMPSQKYCSVRICLRKAGPAPLPGKTAASPEAQNNQNVSTTRHDRSVIQSVLHRPNITPGHHHIVEPDRLALLPILFCRVSFVVSVVLEPEA